MTPTSLETILKAATLHEAAAISHIVLKIASGCLMPSMVLSRPEVLGVDAKTMRQVFSALSLDATAMTGTSLSREEAVRIAREVDSALSAITRAATRHDDRRAESLLKSIRHRRVRLA